MDTIDKQIVELHVRKRWWQLLVIKIATTKIGRWLVLRITTPLDRWLARRTKSRLSFASLAGVPLVLVTTKGAKSGLPRTVPVIYTKQGDDVIVIASKLGSRKHPAWYLNLRANPEASLYFEGREINCVVREAEGEEREYLWHKMVESYPGFTKYKERAGGRRIPVLVFSPV